MLNQDLIKLSKTYASIKKEVVLIAKEIKPKINSIGDALTLQSFFENKFYWKHDLIKIIEISKKYNIHSKKLETLIRKYFETEKRVLKYKKRLEILGLKDISFGPDSIKGDFKNSEVWISVKGGKIKISMISMLPNKQDTPIKVNDDKLRKELKKVLDS